MERTPNASEEAEKWDTRPGDGNAKWHSHSRKTVWWFLKSPDMHLPYDPEIAFVGSRPREMEAYFHRNLNTTIPSNLVGNSLKLETTRMSYSGANGAANLVNPYHGALCSFIAERFT